MAHIDDLLNHVPDTDLRKQLKAAVAEIRDRRQFGIVYESHIPETVALPGLRVQLGCLVLNRKQMSEEPLVVERIENQRVFVCNPKTQQRSWAAISELVVVKPFGDPIYPCLTRLSEIRRGSSRPTHSVINAENYHALQLLMYLYEAQVDCVYLDPPYNSGARDWTYNNHFVDSNDSYRHSKWLSFMEKRLRLAKRLLKPDGVIIITIDENEVYHLGMLLEKIFPEHQRAMITIVISAAGNGADNFSRVEEYAFFCCPKLGREVITGAAIDFLPESGELTADDQEPDYDSVNSPSTEGDDHYLASADASSRVLVENARRRGKDSLRSDRDSMFFPIYIDDVSRTVVSVGRPISPGAALDHSRVEGLLPVWPIDGNGDHRRWRWGYDSMVRALKNGELRVGKFNRTRQSWTINRVETKMATVFRKLKTVWRHPSHAAGTHGSGLLERLLGSSQAFSFPKSVYAVRDCLAAVVRTKPDALIVDVFAGSGTTFHATCLLNAADNGRRRCVLVTNNEVDPNTAASLNAAGYYKGDREFERSGIFEKACRPRCEATVRGVRTDGSAVPGTHLGGRPFAEGFEENVAFYRLDYLDPDEVNLGRQFSAILPLLWLSAGGIGKMPKMAFPSGSWVIPADCPFAVLIDPDHFADFRRQLQCRPDVTHVWIVTDDDQAFARMLSQISGGPRVGMLYREYLRSFAINTERSV
jgi:adenine-specific DNA-methyltransferase